MTIDEKKTHILLKDKSIYKGLLYLSLPLMLSNLLKSVHDIVDMYFVSDLGTGSVSSISITWSMIFIFLAFSFGLGAAGTALISQYLGAKNHKKAKATASQLLLIGIIFGLVFTVLLYSMAPFVLELTGATGFVYENALKYVRIRSFEMLPMFVLSVYTATRQASGDTMSPVIIVVISVVINIILSPLLIRTYGLGVAGAGYATLIAMYAVLPATVYYLLFSKSGVTVTIKGLLPNKKIIKEILKIALPSSLAMAITAIGFTIMNSMIMRQFGEVVFDAFGVGNRINSMVLLPIIAVGNVLATFVGQNVGALQPERAKLVFKKAVIFTVGFSLVGIAIVIPLRAQIVGLFLHNAESLQLCIEYMFYLTFTLPFFAVFQLLLGVFAGLGKAKYTLIVSLSRLWAFRLPMILIFLYFLNMNQNAVWHAMWLSNIFAVILGLYLYSRCTFEPIILTHEEEDYI